MAKPLFVLQHTSNTCSRVGMRGNQLEFYFRTFSNPFVLKGQEEEGGELLCIVVVVVFLSPIVLAFPLPI